MELPSYLDLLDYQDDSIAVKAWGEAVKNLSADDVKAKVIANRARLLSMLSSRSLQVRMAAWPVAVALLKEGLLSEDDLRPLGKYYVEALSSIGPEDYLKAVFVSVAPELVSRGVIRKEEVKAASDAIWKLVDRLGASIPQLTQAVEELLRVGALSKRGWSSGVRVLSDDAIIL
ncbi:hypothetical protein ASAC_1335 [Acidilobus saccharovorans 345-15]|uniref:Uncharacterized protein n=1 Tax=Acidilobus saccharovorans (strain DSM 16705 / JCM 18335 / VKM B-2471 / 345-15) TaxID=666510 RepID=D9Q352_ACIS3|nr:hypothetical protein [Acidilobus saccharovorans]ADL19740.1 hypothetical protein ASAC_1335 [Acidilobus saccharovorans 345-15]